MGKTLNNTGKLLFASEGRARYDTQAVNLMRNKPLLAWILQDCVEEFAGMTREEIVTYIDDVSVRSVPVETGLTNTTNVNAADPQTAMVGELTESKIPGEGVITVITYDLRFTTRIPRAEDPLKRLLFDIELQNLDKPGYAIESRAAINAARMISEQVGRNVTGRNYDSVQKVYSIWICIKTPLVRANSLSISSMQNEAKNGEIPFNGRDDIMRTVYLRLPDENLMHKPKREPTELMTVLTALFSTKLSAAEKMTILEAHGITVTNEEKEGINRMCNLSEGIYRDGLKVGRKEGRKEGREEERKNTLREKQRADAAEQRVRELELKLARSN